ncbi:MAG: hypothetical protein ACSLFL_01920 [Alphaproteobacteria bacterium]
MWNRLRELLENNRGPSKLEYKLKAWLVNAYFNIGAVIGVIAALVTVYQIGDYFLANAHGNADIFYGLLLTVMLSLVAAPLAGVVTCFLWGILPVYYLVVWWQSGL